MTIASFTPLLLFKYDVVSFDAVLGAVVVLYRSSRYHYILAEPLKSVSSSSTVIRCGFNHFLAFSLFSDLLDLCPLSQLLNMPTQRRIHKLLSYYHFFSFKLVIFLIYFLLSLIISSRLLF